MKLICYSELIGITLLKTYAIEGNELEVIWGEPGHPVKRIRAAVARFPYYNGEYRNETCDVDKLIPKKYE